MNSAVHRVFVATPAEGCRACGVVIHRRLAHCIVQESLVSKPRAISVCIHWEGWNFRLIASHLASGHSRESYKHSIENIQEIIEAKDTSNTFLKSKLADISYLRRPIYDILGVDAQTSIGPPRTREERNFIGNAVEDRGARSWKTSISEVCFGRWLLCTG